MAESVDPFSTSLKRLCLASATFPARFCFAQDLAEKHLSLEINGETFKTPISGPAAKLLVSQCRQAPFGKGSETLVDTDVRKVWELPPEQFRILDDDWPETLGRVLEVISQNLWMPKGSLEAKLYRLLVYEKGSFFVLHRDGQKSDRMVGTLVVSLPCRHTGGALVVQHGKEREYLYAHGAASGSSFSIAAFYADCEHEVVKIRSGHRVSLVFNLLVSPEKSTSFAGLSETSEPWREALANWNSSLKKVAILLEHRYTRSSISWELLKGSDRETALSIVKGAKDAGHQAGLALITYTRNGAIEPSGGGRSFYSHSLNWDTGKSRKKPSRPYEIYKQSIVAEFWAPGDDNLGGAKPVTFSMDEVFYDKAFDFHNPSAEEAEGYLGNEGVTADQWYHRAAIVVVKSDRKQ